MSAEPSEKRRDYPDRPILGVGAVIVEGGHVVLIRRGREPLLGRWSIPGGVVEAGETLRQAAIREAREETGLEVEAGELLEVFESIVPGAESGKSEYHYVVIDFLCRKKSGELRAGGDALEARWVRQNQLAELKVSEGACKVVQKAFEKSASGASL
jgi:mutator protein MutT